MFPLFLVATILSITSLTILFVILPTPMRSHRCFKEEHFSGGKITFRKEVRLYFGTSNLQESQNILTCPIFFFTCLKKLPFYVCFDLKKWKAEISSDPYIYLLLVVRFYQISVLFFLYRLKFNFYFKDFPIQNTIYWYSSRGGI